MVGVRVNKNFLLKNSKVHIHVDQGEICYFESEGKYINIFLEDKKYVLRSSLKSILPFLNSNFVRIHTSFVLNVNKIDYLITSEKKVILKNGKEIFFSRGYKDALFEKFIVG